MESKRWQNISKKLQTFNARLFFLNRWWKILMVVIGIVIIGFLQVYLNLSETIPKDYQMAFTPLYIIFYYSWIKTSVYLLWDKYFTNHNERTYIKKRYMKHVSEFGNTRGLEEVVKPSKTPNTTLRKV